jgi:hypothetical protein
MSMQRRTTRAVFWALHHLVQESKAMARKYSRARVHHDRQLVVKAWLAWASKVRRTLTPQAAPSLLAVAGDGVRP